MAGSVVVEYSSGLPVWRVTLTWVSDSSGNVSGTLTTRLSGTLVRVVFDPSANPAPSAGYDVTLLDERGIDLLAGLGGNLSASATSHTIPGVPMTDGTTTGVGLAQIEDALELRVANAGNATRGVVVLYLR